MPLTNAERQKRYRQRLKARAANGPSVYDALVAHFRACTDKDGKLRRRPRKRGRLTPEELANEICTDVFDFMELAVRAIDDRARLASRCDCPAELTLHLEKIVVSLAPPDREFHFDLSDYQDVR